MRKQTPENLFKIFYEDLLMTVFEEKTIILFTFWHILGSL